MHCRCSRSVNLFLRVAPQDRLHIQRGRKHNFKYAGRHRDNEARASAGENAAPTPESRKSTIFTRIISVENVTWISVKCQWTYERPRGTYPRRSRGRFDGNRTKRLLIHRRVIFQSATYTRIGTSSESFGTISERLCHPFGSAFSK